MTRRSVRAKIEIDFLKLVADRARIAAGQENEEIERFVIETAAGASCLTNRTRSVAASSQPLATGIEFVENLELGAFRERFVKRAPLIHFRRAEEKLYFALRRDRLPAPAAILERVLQPRRDPPSLVSPRKFAFFNQTRFAAAKKRKRLQRLDRGTNPSRRLVGAVRAGPQPSTFSTQVPASGSAK